MTKVRCRYPSGEIKDFDKLPEPPPGARWIFEGTAYSIDRYYLVPPVVKVTFRNELGEWSCMSDSIPKEKNLPPIPERTGYLGYWDIPKMLLEPVVLTPVYIDLEPLMPKQGTGLWLKNGKDGCPSCHSSIKLCYDDSKKRYYVRCSSCSYKGPGTQYLEFLRNWSSHNEKAQRE